MWKRLRNGSTPRVTHASAPPNSDGVGVQVGSSRWERMLRWIVYRWLVHGYLPLGVVFVRKPGIKFGGMGTGDYAAFGDVLAVWMMRGIIMRSAVIHHSSTTETQKEGRGRGMERKRGSFMFVYVSLCHCHSPHLLAHPGSLVGRKGAQPTSRSRRFPSIRDRHPMASRASCTRKVETRAYQFKKDNQKPSDARYR